MTRLLLFTDDATVKKRFASVERSRTYDLSVVSGSETRGTVKELQEEALCYVDIGSYSTDIRRLLRDYRDHPTVRIGILDRHGTVTDVAELFHAGAIDYLGPSLFKREIPTKRLNDALEFRPLDSEAVRSSVSDTATVVGKLIPVSGWDEVVVGREYTFTFLFIEVDMVDEWKRKSGKDHLNDVTGMFHKHIERTVAPFDGQVWMWMEHGGIVLFPFDGAGCPVIEQCMKLVLDRTIISAEWYPYNTLITYRMAVHIGNTVFRPRGDTGTIVSDTVNFVFHLGQKFLEPGNLCITETAAPYIHPGLRSCFVPAGTFEGTEIVRMRLPVR